MDIRQLRYFVGVLEARSLTKASGLLHIAQPALGAQIRNLERELGAKLLHRHARGVIPTEAGERLAQHAGELLRQFDLVRQDLMHYAAAPSGRVMLSVGRTIPRIVSATIAERCRIKFPDIQIRIMEGCPKPLDELATPEPDLVVAFRLDGNLPPATESLVQDELAFVTSGQGERLPPEIDFRAVALRTLILPTHPHDRRRLVQRAAELSGLGLKVYCEVDSLETTRELVARGVADTLLPIACVREELKDKKLRAAKVSNRRLQRTLQLFHAHGPSKSSALDLVRREVRSVILEFAQDDSFGWKQVA
jgi:LysR family nitrogen assimilation transcriptional regulator